MIYWIAYYIIKLIGQIFSPRTVVGKEHLPQKGGFILASNHKSNLDPFLIGLCFNRRISYMTKASLFKNPILRFLLHHVEAFPVRRGASDVRALRESLRRLKRGLPLVVFPEGTRQGSGRESKMYPGIGFLAVKGGVPVIPVRIDGSEKVLPPKTRFPKRGRVTVSFGKPLDYSSDLLYTEIVTSIMREIESLS
ncbi:MAG: 1-acyl-sn-glycerol-3-phosphate acyltransferase [Candidatus Omnitrophica bacterium]|nr:1-acyl-sn-glycerol-3-phosphate acyltransferase [Candidatus Omnitrophota bacterium]